jgi:hypothetical protein
MDVSWVPADVCTLPTVERPLRVAEFDVLFSESVVAVERVDPERTRLELAGMPGLEARVQDLADRETGCCSFFSFTVSTLRVIDPSRPDQVRMSLDVEVPAQRAAVLAALTERAEAALQQGSSGASVVGTT